jgi:hypothetical protein
MIFARETSDALTSLVKKIDSATAANESKRMGSFVVFLSDDEALAEKLKSLAVKEGIKHTVLAMDSPAGPAGYDVAKEAAVTVVLYNNRKVEANHAFRKGALNDKGIAAVLADLLKILTD